MPVRPLTSFLGVLSLAGCWTAEFSRESADRQVYPMWGAGLHFVLKPDKRLIANLEYAQGIEDNHGVYLKFGYAW